MLRQTFKYAIRSFRKSKLTHGLNVLGLTLGLSVFFLVTLYIYQEKSYEKDFGNRDRIYQVSRSFTGHETALGPKNLPYVLDEVPEVEAFTTFKYAPTTPVFVQGKEQTLKVFTVDSSFLKVFDFELLIGDRETALVESNFAVINEEKAIELFGTDDVVGEMISVMHYTSDSSYQVPVIINGVSKTPLFKTQLNFDLLVSEQRQVGMELDVPGWQNATVYNYIVASPGTTVQQLDARLLAITYNQVRPTFVHKQMTKEEWLEEGLYLGLYAESLSTLREASDTTLNLMPKLNTGQLRTLSVIALAALLISIVNFINIATAKASVRMKEVGVKRIFGSSKMLLIFQFMLESFLVVLLSSVVALALVEAIVTLKPQSLGIILDYSVLHSQEWTIGLICFVMGLTIVAGIYPAVYLSSSQLVSVLKNGVSKKSFSVLNADLLRKVATVLQFTCSIGLIAAVVTMFLQVDFLRQRDIGYEASTVLVIDNTEVLKESKNTFRNALLQSSVVNSAAYSSRLPSATSWDRPIPVQVNDSTEISFTIFEVDDAFFDVMSMKFAQGESFSQTEISKTNGSIEGEEKEGGTVYFPVVLNEMAAKLMGLENAVGEILLKEGMIIGVVEDFVFSDLRQEVGPVLLMRKSYSGPTNYHFPLVVNTYNGLEAIDEIQAVWSQFSQEEIKYHLLETNYAQLIATEERGFQAVLSFSVLAVIISCLGLLGLAIFTVDQRIHEFGIRKVLGASVRDIMKLFGTGFLKLILVAFVLAIPISIYALQNWLDDFAVRISLNAGIFIATGLITVCLVAVTVLFQSLKAGRLNPVETLRNE